jgi:hypothetical protein
MAYFGPMKTLIIHPEDSTTDFLSQIYSSLPNKTVVKGGIRKSELPKLIDSHDRVLMLGHGSPFGLINAGQFPDSGSYIIDDSMVLPLINKTNSVFIWCNANQFVERHGLEGLNCGMFISEVIEANSYGFENIDEDLIDQSNGRFSWIISNYINQPIEILYQKLLYQYDLMARTNPIARFNLEQLNLTCPRAVKIPFKRNLTGLNYECPF